jgi:hypothetical protein
LAGVLAGVSKNSEPGFRLGGRVKVWCQAIRGGKAGKREGRDKCSERFHVGRRNCTRRANVLKCRKTDAAGASRH